MGKLDGKIGVVMGVANERSLAWAISQALYAEPQSPGFLSLQSSGGKRQKRCFQDTSLEEECCYG